jgi:4'-phosphopantetheinyl transferase EntD
MRTRCAESRFSTPVEPSHERRRNKGTEGEQKLRGGCAMSAPRGPEPVHFQTVPDRPQGVMPSALLRELFPAGVVACELKGPGNPANLLPQEQACIERASLKRACEFAGGRMCARAAMEQLGVSGFPLIAAEDRSPQWPREICGSITHTRNYSAAVAAGRTRFKALGLDAEHVAEMSRDVSQLICSPAEAAWLAQLPHEEQPRLASLIFSAKEAFYKCQYSITRQWLEFRDVTLDIAGWELGEGSFAVRPLGICGLLQHHPLPWVGRFRFWEGLVITGIAFPAT